MYSRCNKAARKAQIAAVVIGAVLMTRAESEPSLNVCVDQVNPTATMDTRVARAVAKSQGYEVKVVPFEGYGKGGDGFPLGRLAKMAQSECELIMGFPVDVSNPNLPPNVEATSAYASTGFVLIRRGSAHKIPLSELPKGSEVGIAQLDTYAGLLYGAHPNIVMHVYPTDSLMLKDLAANRVAAGLAWQPSIEFYERTHPKAPPLKFDLVPGKHMLWNLVALYVPQSQSAANLFAKGLYDLQSKGQLERLIKPYRSAAASGAERTAARPSSAHLQYAVAWNDDAGRLIRVADTVTSPTPKKMRSKVPAHSKVPALYTEDQATKGSLAYYKNCSMCHGPLLDGQSAGYPGPALKGPEFADPSYDFHLNEMFNFVAKLMPPGEPGTLTHEEYVQIMAFILQQNGYPVGGHELIYEEAEKSKVPIRYYGK
jgi:ABC-type amino acid transport substrate-binding protein/mono/diheme cytochrome c family protein